MSIRESSTTKVAGRVLAYIRCRLGLHYWTNWRKQKAENFLVDYYQVHKCRRCKYQEKVAFI